MNTPDTLTLTITRGRWSVTRSCDLDLITGETDSVTRTELLNDLLDETIHAFGLACRHLDNFAPFPFVEQPSSTNPKISLAPDSPPDAA